MQPFILPPGVVAKTYVYRNGRTGTVYTAPYPEEGPAEFTDRSGRAVWIYMYAHFVFYWPEGATYLRVGHGSIKGPTLRLWDGVPITGDWSASTLREFGRQWVRDCLAGCSPHRSAPG